MTTRDLSTLYRLARCWLVALLLTAGAACGPAGEDQGTAGSDDLAGATASFAPTYFAVRSDARMCPSPTCGGFWVSAVNQPSTVCADGTRQRECYAATLDLSALKLTATQEIFVRAAIGASAASPAVLFQGKLAVPSTGTTTLGVLVASQAWLAPVAATLSGSFYGLGSSGIVCITTPCPTIQETLLDVMRVQNISQVDLSRAPGTDQDKAAAQAAIFAEGLIAAGTHQVVHDRSRTTVLRATQYYRLVVPPVDPCAGVSCPTGYSCVVRGTAPFCLPDTGERCGTTICPVGQVCCNPEMNICTAPGQFCVQ